MTCNQWQYWVTAGIKCFHWHDIWVRYPLHHSCIHRYMTSTHDCWFVLFVLPALPQVNVTAQTLMALIDSHVTFTCLVLQGDPPPSITWNFNEQGLPLSNSSKDTVTESASNSSLTVFTLHPFDAGEYSCVANNTFGSSNDSTVLYVQGVSTDIGL